MGLGELGFHFCEDPLAIVHFDGTLAEANLAWAALANEPARDLAGRPLAALVHAEDGSVLDAALARARAGTRCSFQVRVRSANDDFIPLHLSSTPMPVDGCVLFVARRPATTPLLGPAAPLAPGAPPEAPLRHLVERLATALGVTHALLATGVDWPPTRVRTAAAWVNGGPLAQPFEYELAGTPCEGVSRGALCAFSERVQQSFPDDRLLVEMGAESYVGAPILDARGDVLGHVCVLDDAPMTADQQAARTAAVQAAAAEATYVLERIRMRDVLAQAAGHVNAPPGLPRVRELVRLLAEATHVQYVLVSLYEGDPPVAARAIVFWAGGSFREPFVYALQGTPCDVVARRQLCRVPDHLRQAFPDDPDLDPMAAESYLGVSLADSAGRVFGQVSLLDVRPMPLLEEMELILRLFAARIWAELDRGRAEQVAVENEARFRLLVEHAADALILYDRAGLIVDVNPAALAGLGAARGEIVGTRIRDWLAGPSDEALLAEASTLAPGAPLTSNAVFARRDGTTFPAEVRTVAYEESGRELLLSIARDVTEQRRAEEAIRAAMRAMSTPILQVGEGVLALPLIGAVDRERASRVMSALLEAILHMQAEVTILDLTGVSEVDASTASHLLDIARAASLLGSRCLVSGIAPSVARTLVDLGAPATDLRTFGTLQAALAHVMGGRLTPMRSASPTRARSGA